jgi:hypothetical protein
MEARVRSLSSRGRAHLAELARPAHRGTLTDSALFHGHHKILAEFIAVIEPPLRLLALTLEAR